MQFIESSYFRFSPLLKLFCGFVLVFVSLFVISFFCLGIIFLTFSSYVRRERNLKLFFRVCLLPLFPLVM